MKKYIIEYFEEALGEEIKLEKWIKSIDLPPYLIEENEFLEGKILDSNIIFLIPNTIINIKTIEKKINSIKRYTNKHVCIVMSEISTYLRKELIRAKIPFVFINKQIYLPFIALEYNDINNLIKNDNIESFTPAAQAIYLYLLYNNKETSIDELSTVINMTKMTVSRSIKELVMAKLLEVRIEGKTNRKKIYKPIIFNEYFEKGYKYLKSPIKKVIYTKIRLDEHQYLLAGESALAQRSMLVEPNEKSYALYWKESKHVEIEDEPITRLELWTYDPRVLAKNGFIDIISLKLSLENENDERINYEIETLIKESKWYKG